MKGGKVPEDSTVGVSLGTGQIRGEGFLCTSQVDRCNIVQIRKTSRKMCRWVSETTKVNTGPIFYGKRVGGHLVTLVVIRIPRIVPKLSDPLTRCLDRWNLRDLTGGG